MRGAQANDTERQGKAGQGRAGQGKAGQGKAGRGKARRAGSRSTSPVTTTQPAPPGLTVASAAQRVASRRLSTAVLQRARGWLRVVVLVVVVAGVLGLRGQLGRLRPLRPLYPSFQDAFKTLD
jgi:hypothetical protein